MRMQYIKRIESGMKNVRPIKTGRATSQVLDGSYNSIYKGRSMNFDELREYADGDDVKDVDWKASARSGKLLLRQFVAEKKHNIMFILDTNRRMFADTDAGEIKKDVALLSAGTLGYLVDKNGDYVSAVFSNEEGKIEHYPFKTGLMNLESILAGYDRAVTMNNHTDINSAMDFIIHNFRRKMIIVIVTDMAGIQSITETNLKRLLVLNDVLLVNIKDGTVFGKNVYALNEGFYLPDFFTKDRKLKKKEEANRKKAYEECVNKLKKFGVASSDIGTADNLDMQIVELMNKHKFIRKF